MKKGTVHLIHAQVLLLNFTGTLLARKLLAKCFIYKSLPMDRKNIFRGHRIQVYIVFISIGQKKRGTQGATKRSFLKKRTAFYIAKSHLRNSYRCPSLLSVTSALFLLQRAKKSILHSACSKSSYKKAFIQRNHFQVQKIHLNQ